MTKPDYILIGAMKCGTSTVRSYLEAHPDVFIVPGQEPRFFSHDENYARGLDWYRGLYDGAAGHKLAGEGTNDYANGARYPDTAARIAAFAPDARILYFVRHPLDRIVSAWIQNRADKRDKVAPTLDAAVTEQPEIFVDQSLYWSNLSLYRAHFPDTRIHIGFMEDLKADPEAFFADICGFLGIPPAPRIDRPHVNKSEGKRLATPLYSKINRIPGMAAAKGLLSSDLKQRIRETFFERELEGRPEFSPTVRAALLNQLRLDAEAFLAHCGRPADFWKF